MVMAGASLALARSQHDFDFQPAGGEKHFVKSIYDFVLIFKVSMIIIPSTTAAKRVLNKWKEHATFCRSAAAWCVRVCVSSLEEPLLRESDGVEAIFKAVKIMANLFFLMLTLAARN